MVAVRKKRDIGWPHVYAKCTDGELALSVSVYACVHVRVMARAWLYCSRVPACMRASQVRASPVRAYVCLLCIRANVLLNKKPRACCVLRLLFLEQQPPLHVLHRGRVQASRKDNYVRACMWLLVVAGVWKWKWKWLWLRQWLRSRLWLCGCLHFSVN